MKKGTPSAVAHNHLLRPSWGELLSPLHLSLFQREPAAKRTWKWTGASPEWMSRMLGVTGEAELAHRLDEGMMA